MYLWIGWPKIWPGLHWERYAYWPFLCVFLLLFFLSVLVAGYFPVVCMCVCACLSLCVVHGCSSRGEGVEEREVNRGWSHPFTQSAQQQPEYKGRSDRTFLYKPEWMHCKSYPVFTLSPILFSSLSVMLILYFPHVKALTQCNPGIQNSLNHLHISNLRWVYT